MFAFDGAEHRIDVEGLLYERSIKDSVGGESEWDRRHLAIEASREGARSSDAFRVRVGTAKETWTLTQDANLTPDFGSRERWEFPTIDAEGSMSWHAGPALTWIASAKVASRKIHFLADSVPEFEPRRMDARLNLGTRHALGADARVGIDAAYDMRETQPGFWDARASLWAGGARLHGRFDLESAHQRPSWVDLLTPPTSHTFVVSDPVFVLSELSRSGDPGLRPRRLAGALGSVTFTPEERLRFEFSGSCRRVTDDFGWEIGADTVGGVYRVSSVARARGSGRCRRMGIQAGSDPNARGGLDPRRPGRTFAQQRIAAPSRDRCRGGFPRDSLSWRSAASIRHRIARARAEEGSHKRSRRGPPSERSRATNPSIRPA